MRNNLYVPDVGLDGLVRAVTDEWPAAGREDSFKMSAGRLLAKRTMLGVRTRDLAPAALARIQQRLGMPPALAARLQAGWPQANVALFAAEEDEAGCTFKVYLEFWDAVRAHVARTGSRDPLLLNLGAKWRAGEAEGRLARYVCHPLLDTGECLQRMAALCGGPSAAGHALARDLVMLCAGRRPGASMVYLEADEEGTPRRSFDLNLYKAGVPMADLAPWLRSAWRHFGLDDAALEPLLAGCGQRLLGHLSGGTDRFGGEFLTVYYEIEAM